MGAFLQLALFIVLESSFPLIAKANSQRQWVLSNIAIGWKFSQRACVLGFAMSGKESLKSTLQQTSCHRITLDQLSSVFKLICTSFKHLFIQYQIAQRSILGSNSDRFLLVGCRSWGSFPLIAKANSQARCENFHPITTFENTRFPLQSFCPRGRNEHVSTVAI